jgi:hypothetical protein
MDIMVLTVQIVPMVVLFLRVFVCATRHSLSSFDTNIVIQVINEENSHVYVVIYDKLSFNAAVMEAQTY